MVQKLTSRKFWMAVAGIITGLCVAFGGDAGEIQTVAGTVGAVVSAVAYIMAESKVDAANAGGDNK